MKATRPLLLLIAALLGQVTAGVAATALDGARRLEEAGQFKAAAAFLQSHLSQAETAGSDRKQLEFALDRLERIRLDYPLTREMLWAKLKDAVRDLKDEEFEHWIGEPRFDHRSIDGEDRFMVSSVANLFWRYPQLNPRRIQHRDQSYQKAMWQECVAIEQAAARERQPYVLPKEFDVTMTVTVDADATAPGQIVRAWLPVPRRYPYQDGFVVAASSSPLKALAPETSAIRSVYLEQPAATNAATVFQVRYRYDTRGVRFHVDPEHVFAFDGRNSEVAAFTREAPHVRFTPEMKALSNEILAGEKNPARQAKAFYDWIGANIQYSFATEYSTIPNIGEYCRSHRYGDCGQEALLFLTLCRLNGIPARWQSGWDTFPGAKDIHDWTEIYLPPYGWIPVDPYMSVFATQYADQLTPGQRRELRDFYFGGRGHWRMAANADHDQPLSPAKKSFRSDDVDFQRGEIECAGRNVYFNQYHYELDANELPLSKPDAVEAR